MQATFLSGYKNTPAIYQSYRKGWRDAGRGADVPINRLAYAALLYTAASEAEARAGAWDRSERQGRGTPMARGTSALSLTQFDLGGNQSLRPLGQADLHGLSRLEVVDADPANPPDQQQRADDGRDRTNRREWTSRAAVGHRAII